MDSYLDWVEAEVGVRAHRVIAGLMTGDRRPDPRAALAACRADLEAHPEPDRVRRRATAQGLRSCVAVYLTVAWPGEGWRCIGAEVRLGKRVADLVLEHDDGRVLIDEVKTGEVPSFADAQVRDLLAAGRRRWSRNFCGVRVVPLSNLAAMWLADRSGQCALFPVGGEL